MAEFLRPPLSQDALKTIVPPNLSSESTEFHRIFPQPPITIRTDLTTDHLRAISEWENSIWTQEPKPYVETRGQFLQELGEVKEAWLDGKADLTSTRVRLHVGEEIGDGIIASIGILRSVLQRDDIRIQGFLSKALNQPVSQKRMTPESRVRFYQKNGEKLLKVLDEVGNSGQFSDAHKTEVVNAVGSSMKAGIEAMEALRMKPGHVIEGKTKLMKLKYSPPRVAANGSPKEAKRDWDQKQLLVFQPHEVVLLAA